jgi:outer membrane protein assembly factor BamB
MPDSTDAPERAARGGWSFFHLFRFGLGLLITVALSYWVLFAWVFVTIRGMPQKKTLFILLAGVLAVIVLTFGLFRTESRRRWNMVGFLALAVAWIASGAIVGVRSFDENVGNPLELGPFFGICTLGFPVAAWFFAWSGTFAKRVAAVVLLLLCIPLFQQWARIDGLSGDESKVSMAWRRTIQAPSPATSAETATNSRDYPQYLGPGRNARLDDLSLDGEWEKHPPKLLWKEEIGSGLGAFSVVGNRAVTMQQMGKEEAITCLDLKTGKVLWNFKYPALFEHGLAKSGPRSTPAIHDNRVFAIGALGTLTCLELADGKKVWQIDTTSKGAREIPYGVAGSPLVLKDRVIVCRPSTDGKSVAAYDVHTGKLIWEAGNAEAAYSSPFHATVAGEEEVIVFNADNVIGVNPSNGELRWSFPWTNNEKNNCSQPIFLPGSPDQLFVSTGYGKGSVLLSLEKSDEGEITPKPLWESKQMKNKFSTSFVIGDSIYGLDDGILSAIDLTTGKKLWKKDRIGHGQLLLVGDNLLALTESGNLELFEVSPKGSKRIGQIEGALDGKSWNHMALAAPYLLIRNDHEAACFELMTMPRSDVKEKSTESDATPIK